MKVQNEEVMLSWTLKTLINELSRPSVSAYLSEKPLRQKLFVL